MLGLDNFLANIPSTVCFISAAVLSYNGIYSWLYFLIAGFLALKNIRDVENIESED